MHRKSASHLSFEVIYRHAYKIVLKKKADEFYDRLQDWETKWLSNNIKSGLQQSLSPALIAGDEESCQMNATEKRAAGEKFLQGCKNTWDDHNLVMNMATDVFMYLDRVHCNDQNRPSIYSAGMAQFKDCVLLKPISQVTSSQDVVDLTEDERFSPPTMLEVIKKIILDQIAMERDGDIIEKSVIKGCVYMLEGLYETAHELDDERLYLTSFEQDFLDASRAFYRSEGTKLLEQADAATYCRHTIRRIKEEQDRCRSTLSSTTEQKITHVIEDELIKSRIKQLILMDSGVKNMVENDRFDDLSLIFDLNSRIDSKKMELIHEIQRRVVEVGARIHEAASTSASGQAQAQAQDKDDAQKQEESAKSNVNQQTLAALQWVEAILSLKDKYDHLWEKSFVSDPIIQPALTKSFTESINSFPRCSEFISLFIDDNMKKGIKDKTETEIDGVLEKAITLLRYIQDKDMFERYYKKHLCKRLLMRKSVSIDIEKQMVSRMKIELGNSFTSKLENMFKDMALSEELTAGYKTRVSGGESRTELGINVLTTMVWPLETMSSSNEEEQKLKCIYPPTIDRIKKGFETFYASKHSGRQLTWMANMGTADMRAVFPKVPGAKEGTKLAKERRHDLNVSTYAMCILMVFNGLSEGASLSFDDIQEKTNIGDSELKRNLQALAVAPKTRILIKEPMTRDVKKTDRFTFNDSFTSQFFRLKVGVVAPGNKVEGEKERVETEKKNNESRGYAIDAAVVRIMK